MNGDQHIYGPWYRPSVSKGWALLVGALLKYYTEHSHRVSVVHCLPDFNKMKGMTYYLFLFWSWELNLGPDVFFYFPLKTVGQAGLELTSR